MAKILVVDDEQGVRYVLDKFLTRNGFEVVLCEDGVEGIAEYDKNKDIELILLDHRMPNSDGEEVLKELKSRGNKIPVILLTGSIGKKTGQLEVDALMTKPIDLQEICAKIKELLGE